MLEDAAHAVLLQHFCVWGDFVDAHSGRKPEEGVHGGDDGSGKSAGGVKFGDPPSAFGGNAVDGACEVGYFSSGEDVEHEVGDDEIVRAGEMRSERAFLVEADVPRRACAMLCKRNQGSARFDYVDFRAWVMKKERVEEVAVAFPDQQRAARWRHVWQQRCATSFQGSPEDEVLHMLVRLGHTVEVHAQGQARIGVRSAVSARTRKASGEIRCRR